jgi:hypothetical protein
MLASLHEIAQGSANSAGAAGLSFGPVSQGQVWTGSITIPAATPSSVLPITWTAYDSGTPIGSWYNNQSSGTLQARGTVTVSGTGVALGTLVAYFSGIATDTASAPPWWPSPTPAPPPAVPKQIVSNAVPLGTTVTQIGSDQPVIVGTSLEIFEAAVAPFGGGPGGAVRLQILWSIDGSFVDPVEYDFDIALNANMRGLVLPNLAPFVRFNAIRSAGATQLSLTVFTGLATLVRPPIVPQGVLFSASSPLSSIVLPPYVGPCAISMSPNNSAGFGIQIVSSDYLGAGKATIRQEQGWPAGTGPFVSEGIVYLPPLINTLTVSGDPGGATITGVALGP